MGINDKPAPFLEGISVDPEDGVSRHQNIKKHRCAKLRRCRFSLIWRLTNGEEPERAMVTRVARLCINLPEGRQGGRVLGGLDGEPPLTLACGRAEEKLSNEFTDASGKLERHS